VARLANAPAHEINNPLAVISGRASAAVARRLTELGVTEVHQGIADKSGALAAMVARLGLELDDVAAMGDDLTDLPLLKRVGVALAPRNAVPEVARAAIAWAGHPTTARVGALTTRARRTPPCRAAGKSRRTSSTTRR